MKGLRTSEHCTRYFQDLDVIHGDHHKQRSHVKRLRQLARLGVELSEELGLEDNQTNEIVAEQAAGPDVCPISELADGRTQFVVWLSLAAEKPGVRLYDFRMEPPWPDNDFRQLPKFEDSYIDEHYVLPSGLDYPREDVLNLRFLQRAWQVPCARVEGVLCALSGTPIPKEYRHGANIDVEVKFFGRSGQQLGATTVVLCADLWHTRAATRRTTQKLDAVGHRLPDDSPTPNRSVFEEPDASGSSGASPTPDEAQEVALPGKGSERLKPAPVRHKRLKKR
jgi:hypothetical protein